MRELGGGKAGSLTLSSAPLPSRRTAWNEVMQAKCTASCAVLPTCSGTDVLACRLFLPLWPGGLEAGALGAVPWPAPHRARCQALPPSNLLLYLSLLWNGQVGGRLARWELYHDLHRVEHAAKRGPCSRSLQAASSDWRQPGYHVLNAHLAWLLPSLLQVMRCLNAVWEPQVCAWALQANKLLEHCRLLYMQVNARSCAQDASVFAAASFAGISLASSVWKPQRDVWYP